MSLNLAWILTRLKTLSISLIDDSAAATQPLRRSARVADAATQPLCQSGWSSYSATQPHCQSDWRSHSATQPFCHSRCQEWLEQPLSHSARVAGATQPLSHSATVAGAATQPLSHSEWLSGWVAASATLPEWLSGWCENFRHCAFNQTKQLCPDEPRSPLWLPALPLMRRAGPSAPCRKGICETETTFLTCKKMGKLHQSLTCFQVATERCRNSCKNVIHMSFTAVSCLLCLGCQRAIEVTCREWRHVLQTTDRQWTCWKQIDLTWFEYM